MLGVIVYWSVARQNFQIISITFFFSSGNLTFSHIPVPFFTDRIYFLQTCSHIEYSSNNVDGKPVCKNLRLFEGH
jgi:hypothetical protein